MISKFAVSNSYKTALANNDIVIKVYKDIFVIIEYHQINSAVNRYSKIKKPALSFDEMFAKEKNQRTTAIKTLIIIAAAEAALLLLRLSHCFLL